MIDTYRGSIRVRKWPEPRGPSATPAQAIVRARFASAIDAIKYVDGISMSSAIKATKGTGLYPRDLLMSAMLRGIADLELADGRVLTIQRPQVEAVTFQGARIERTSNQGIPAGLITTVSWQSPKIDTATFWSAGAPTRLTVPASVNTVNVRFAAAFTTATTGQHSLNVYKNGTQVAQTNFANSSTPPVAQVETGPLSVAPGDYFEAVCYIPNGNTVAPGSRTNFTLEVIGAS